MARLAWRRREGDEGTGLLARHCASLEHFGLPFHRPRFRFRSNNKRSFHSSPPEAAIASCGQGEVVRTGCLVHPGSGAWCRPRRRSGVFSGLFRLFHRATCCHLCLPFWWDVPTVSQAIHGHDLWGAAIVARLDDELSRTYYRGTVSSSGTWTCHQIARERSGHHVRSPVALRNGPRNGKANNPESQGQGKEL